MVNILIESLLSTSSNRKLYESLWNLSISKKSKQTKSEFDFETQKICEICDLLKHEITQEGSGQKNFYFTSQIAFGAVLLFRLQIDKLYNQVKLALQSCNSTFNDLNWLRQMTDASTYENKNTQTIKKNMKNDQEFLSSEMDLLEQVFKIPDDPKLKQSSKEKSHKHVHDETMATDLSSITLIEFYETKTVDYANIYEDDIGDFGDLEQDFNFTFYGGQQENQAHRSIVKRMENDQQVPELRQCFDSPECLRNDQTATPNEVNLHEIGICEDDQKLDAIRNRRTSRTCDISLRLQPLPKELKLSENFRREEFRQFNDISSFDDEANEPEIVGIMNKFPNEDEIHACVHSIQKRKSQKLIVDKHKEINDDAMKNMKIYGKKFTLESPMDTFEQRLLNQKRAIVCFFKLSSRLKYSAKVLHPIFERNLKSISVKLLKRTRDLDIDSEPSIKRQREYFLQPMDSLTLEPIPVDFEEQPNLQSFEEQQDVNMIDAEHNQGNEKPADVVTYRECEKWSKQRIIKNLKGFWERDNDVITMARLTKSTNRFVAAGIFFELMLLSKVGAVDLKQDVNLEIINILPGHRVEIYLRSSVSVD